MARRPLLLALLALLPLHWGASCSGGVKILEPGEVVETFSFPVEIQLTGDFVPGTLEVLLNGVPIDDRLSGDGLVTGVIEPGSPLLDKNELLARAQGEDGNWTGAMVKFVYDPPGKARARKIVAKADLIYGPLAHSRLGDWLIANGEARFIVQDVAQRELYSVGQYGGNLIDAEVVGNPGKDNWLEFQPGLNIETVINAQTVDVVNDGQDGTAAILRTCGPDDLLDFVNPSSQVTDLGLAFPPLADDRDLDIEGCTSYILEPGDSHVRVETEVFSNYTMATLPDEVGGARDSLPLLVGDWINPSGELDTVARANDPHSGLNPAINGVSPPVATSLGTLGFFGYDEGAGTDYSFTQIPLEGSNIGGTMVFISGVLVVLHSQNALLTLIGADPIRFNVPNQGSLSFTRFIGVGTGSGSNAFDLENEVKGNAVGTVQGCVTVAGAPAAGARVSVGNPLGTGLNASPAADQFFQHFTTAEGACPNFSGSIVPGAWLAAAGLDGHLYEGGAPAAPLKAFNVVAGGMAQVDFDLPSTGRLDVQIVDRYGAGIPARVTVVGFDPSPELISGGPVLPAFGGDLVGLLNDINDRLPFGVTAVGYAGMDGNVQFDLEPGTGLYHVYVSRGTEYSSWRTAAPLDVAAGAVTVVEAQIARVIDTPGFVSSDFHVHGIRSADSRVSDTHRVESYSAEGVENVVMTDHHVHTDLLPAIRNAGAERFLTATIGEEITSFDYGHFNAYPMKLDPNSPTKTVGSSPIQLSGGSTDWAQAAPPGMDFPIYGALNAVPSQIFDLATNGALSHPGITTIQINHIDSHFEPLMIDTSIVPPQDGMTDVDRANRRLPDTTAVPNLFHHFPALELWNGDNRGAQSQFLSERIGIWFNHLNQGLPTTFIADTDSHRFTNLNSAGARSWTASPTDDPKWVAPAEVAASVDAGRVVGGQGIYVQTRLRSTDGSGSVADLGWSGQTEMTDSDGEVVLEIDVQSPAWAQWDRVEVYANAGTFTAGSAYLFGADPQVVLEEGDCDPTTTGDGDFDVDVTADVGGVAGADKLSASLEVGFSGLTEDTWFVVVVSGTDDACEPMFPVYPDSIAQGSNGTLEDLVDGNLGEGGTMALGATNALYFRP